MMCCRPTVQVLPFILLGLGVDDSFVICNSFGRTDPRKSIPERMKEGLGHAGQINRQTDRLAVQRRGAGYF